MAVIELASFHPFSQIHEDFLDQLMESIGVVLNMISANMRTEELLERSQSLAQELQSRSQELQSQQEQLKESNSILEAQARELEERASLLADQNMQVEHKNREVELARTALEEKAEQLALSSKYKSEFLANMSHELRTPLNSMLILAKLLSDNQESNLTGKQVEFANTIYASGGDLLNLINEILDLSKVESGKMEIEVGDMRLVDLKDYIERTFEPVANGKGLEFSVDVEPGTPEIVRTDVSRLQQVLKNLLSNAFKFTDQGRVTLTITRAAASELGEYAEGLSSFNRLVAFRVSDTGIGIARDKQKLIFEAFQQADGTTSRKYGGTGLGLSISREITRLLGGRIMVESEPGRGSTFTLVCRSSTSAPRWQRRLELHLRHNVHLRANSVPSASVRKLARDSGALCEQHGYTSFATSALHSCTQKPPVRAPRTRPTRSSPLHRCPPRRCTAVQEECRRRALPATLNHGTTPHFVDGPERSAR
jgi:signal transduction histidine kinase